MLERKEKNMEKKEREKYYQRNGEDVERLRAKGRWMNVKLSERDKDTKQERRERIKESRYNRESERCMTEEILEYLGGESAKEKDLDVGMRREETGIRRKEMKQGAECAMRKEKQLSTCGMDVAK
jgi:hypothetical protein